MCFYIMDLDQVRMDMGMDAELDHGGITRGRVWRRDARHRIRTAQAAPRIRLKGSPPKQSKGVRDPASELPRVRWRCVPSEPLPLLC
jgi:hypothetical protein